MNIPQRWYCSSQILKYLLSGPVENMLSNAQTRQYLESANDNYIERVIGGFCANSLLRSSNQK